MAPSTSPSLTIPLVFALAGNATWFVYLLATAATLLVGFCVSRFARLSASPGSLYSYASDTLPPVFGVVAAWGLLLAYLATGASVAGGALYYAGLLSQQFFHWTPPTLARLLSSAPSPDGSPTATSSSQPSSCFGLKWCLSA
jgi:amino acid transporter